MSSAPVPVVRSLIACEEIVAGDAASRRLSLIRVINTIRASGDPPYPVLCPQFAVFAVLTNARGEGELWLEIRRDDDDSVLYESTRQRVTFPTDPLALSGLSYRIRNLAFPAAGLYWVRLSFDGSPIAELPVVLK